MGVGAELMKYIDFYIEIMYAIINICTGAYD